jgi:Transglutaminase-like superfamily
MARIRLGLRFQSFQDLLKALRLDSSPGIHTPTSDIALPTLLWSVNRSSAYMPGNVVCLARALTTQVLMNRHGYATEICIGVKLNEQGNLEAHAWVEHDGKVIIGKLSDLASYQALPSLTAVKL